MPTGDKVTFYFQSKLVEVTYELGDFSEAHGGDRQQVKSTRNMFVLNMYGEMKFERRSYEDSKVGMVSRPFADLPHYSEEGPSLGNVGVVHARSDQTLDASIRLPHAELKSILPIVTSGQPIRLILGCEYVGDVYHKKIPTWHVLNLEVKLDVGDVSESDKHQPINWDEL